MNKLFFTLIAILCSRIVFPQNISGLANYKMLDAFVSDSRNETLISAGFYDYNNNGSEQIVYYFALKNEWHVVIRDNSGKEYARLSGEIDSGKTVRQMTLFRYKGLNFLALLAQIKNSETGNPNKFGLYVIDMSNDKTIDSLEAYTWDFFDYPSDYKQLDLICLKALNTSDGLQIFVGVDAKDNGFGPGEYQYEWSMTKSLIFGFNDSLKYLTYCPNSGIILPKSGICYGFESGWSSTIVTNNSSYSYSIFNYDSSKIISEDSLIYFSKSFGYNLQISSDDSSNRSHAYVVLWYRGLIGLSLKEGTIMWNYNSDGFRVNVSANLTVDNKYYVICFYGYQMWIIRRDDGQGMHYEYGTISPIRIIEDPNGKLYYLIKAGQQTYALYEMENFNSIVSVKKDKPDTPGKFLISQNYPNPFNPSTIIEYSIPRAAHVKLILYDALGRIIKTLVDSQKPGGNYSVNFDGSNLPSGVYFYQIRAGVFTATRKMLLLK